MLLCLPMTPLFSNILCCLLLLLLLLLAFVHQNLPGPANGAQGERVSEIMAKHGFEKGDYDDL